MMACASRPLIAAPYRTAIHGDSRFVVNSRLAVRVGLDGVALTGAAPQEWLEGGVTILPGTQGAVRSHYPLYRDAEAARDGIRGDQPPTTLTPASRDAARRSARFAGALPQVPYRRNRHHPRRGATAFEIALYIQPAYRHLVGNESVFWAEGGAKVQLNGAGLTVQAAPLARALKGAISLDNLSGVQAARGAPRVHSPMLTRAPPRAVGGHITLSTYDGARLAPGMPIRYLGSTSASWPPSA
ncbi:paraquat-inducible protein B [Edwardsiella tarda]|nr:paraquat-inducible protein B [Edwardsiella tarda]